MQNTILSHTHNSYISILYSCFISWDCVTKTLILVSPTPMNLIIHHVSAVWINIWSFNCLQYPSDRQPGQKLDTEFFRYNASHAKVPFFLNTREVTTRFHFNPGTYVVIPSTFEPEVTGEYLLRIFTEKKWRSWERESKPLVPGSREQKADPQCRGTKKLNQRWTSSREIANSSSSQLLFRN